MLGVKKSTLASDFLKTLIRTGVQAYLISLLSSNGNSNHFDLDEKLGYYSYMKMC